jgi:cell wall-associated NlpC family hydrolase
MMRWLLPLLVLAALYPGAANARAGAPFATDVPGIEEAMLAPDYWLADPQLDTRRMSSAELRRFNRRSLQLDDHLHDLGSLPPALPREQVIALLEKVSRPASSARYFAADGREVTAGDYRRWEAATAPEAIPPSVELQWGLVVRRDSMRSYPTRERILKSPDDADLDRLQETGVFPGQALAILHSSADGEWLFALNYHYGAWLPREAVAIGRREQVLGWRQQEPRLVVTGATVKTNFNPEDPRSASLRLEMGSSFPLLSAAEVGHNVNGQNPYASHIVSLPLRRADGSLEFGPALVARSQDVATDYLPLTGANLVKQAFKFLGERYGWGHDYQGRDCTGFVGEVYKSMGVLMPRNSGQQGRSAFAPTQQFAPGDTEAVVAALAELEVGDLIYIPGHVMMYIGHVGDEPYVIHDVTGLSYLDAAGDLYRGTLSGVAVTPLTPLRLGADTRYIDRIYAIKRIALQDAS